MARVWMPDYPPASASAYDDEFSDESLDVMWTEFDQPGNLTVSEAEYGLSLLATTDAGDNIGGIFQAVPPSGDWAIWTKVSLLASNANYNEAGLMLGQDLTSNPATSDLVTFHLFYSNGAQYVTAARWNQYDTFGAVYAEITDVVISTDLYLRIRKSSTTYRFDYSFDGIGWTLIYSGTIAFVPAEMGVFLNNINSGVTSRAVFQFFRCVTGTPAMTDVMPGDRVL